MENGGETFEVLAKRTRSHYKDAMKDFGRRKDASELREEMKKLIEERSSAAQLGDKETFGRKTREIERINAMLDGAHEKSSGPDASQD